MAINDGLLDDEEEKATPSAGKSSLAALRISPVITSADRDDKRRRKSNTDARRRRTRHSLATLKPLAGPGFDFEVDIDELTLDSSQTATVDISDDGEVRRTLSVSMDEETSAGVKRLAHFFLESGRAMNARYNVVDALDDERVTKATSPLKKLLQISRSTRNRKETVMAALTLKYHWLVKCQEDYVDGEVHYPGVEGVYNPLQIIRNRAIRAKYHEPAPPLRYANLPLACNAFSSHRKLNGRPWKMLWGIELNELVNDSAWRSLHWNELRNARGELWFPNLNPRSFPQSAISFDTPTHPKNHQSRLHDKLWNETDADDKSVADSRFPYAKSLQKNIKQKAKRLYGSTSSVANSTSDGENSGSDPQKSRESLLRVKDYTHMKSASDASGGLIFQIPRKEESSGSSDTRKSRLELPKITVDNSAILANEIPDPKNEIQHNDFTGANRSKMTLDDVHITPLHTRQSSFSPEVMTTDTASRPLSEPVTQPVDEKAVKLGIARSRGHTVDQHLLLQELFLSEVYPHLINSTSDGLQKILTKKINVLLYDIVQVNDSQLPAHEAFYTGFLGECKSLMHIMNDKFAVKIDNLLSATDRSMGELNTSLSLDLKKVNEHLDKVNQSLFGSLVASSIGENDRDMTFSDGGRYRILYLLLENLIVFLLRLTWLVVNIYKFILGTLKLIWKVTSLLFGV